MRRLLLAACFVLALLAVVLAVNTARQSSQQIAVTPLAVASVEVEAAARRLGAAIRARTISFDDRHGSDAGAFAELHTLLQASYPAAHRALERETVNGASLLYVWRGTDPALAPAMLLAHQDVVPVAPGTEADWRQDPFAGTIADGFVWGRGAWDDKGNLMAILEAVEALAAQGVKPRRTLYLGFGHDEEIGGAQGAAAIAAVLRARGVRLDFVLDEGLLVTEGIVPGMTAPVALVGTAEKGDVTLELAVHTSPGHASMPPARTAIGTLSEALVRLEEAPQRPQLRGAAREMFETLAPEYPGAQRLLFSNLWLFEPVVCRVLDRLPSGRAMLRTTTALTSFHAGDKENVLPGQADAKVNVRLLPGDTVEALLERSRAVVGDPAVRIAAGSTAWNPSAQSSTDSASYRTLARAIREVFPGAIVAPGLMIAATDSRRYEGLTTQIYRFTPVRAGPGDLARFHGTNERISLANYAEMIRFYRRLIELSALGPDGP